MKVYYKGCISREIKKETFKLMEIRNASGNSFVSLYPESVNRDKVNYENKNEIYDYVYDNIDEITYQGIEIENKKIINLLERILYSRKTEFAYKYQEIIYEKIEDVNGNIYGREIITGLIFPIYHKLKEQKKYKLFKQSDMGHTPVGTYFLTIEKSLELDSMKKCICMINSEAIADNNEVEVYKAGFQQGLCKKIKQKKFTKLIKILYNQNVFCEEITTKEEIVRIKETQNIGTTVMENIEYLLTKISKINKEKYIEYKKQYETILENENLLVTSLASFEGKLEFYLMFNKKGIDNIIDYLETLKLEYLENNINQANIDTQINLDDIDKIEELFLKSKNDYSLVSQRKILKDIAFIYLMEVYENIENIPTELLRRSYFISNLKTILIVIESLRELRLIENNIIIDLNTDITLDNILHIIRRIKFNNETKESIPTLIKKL